MMYCRPKPLECHSDRAYLCYLQIINPIAAAGVRGTASKGHTAWFAHHGPWSAMMTQIRRPPGRAKGGSSSRSARARRWAFAVMGRPGMGHPHAAGGRRALNICGRRPPGIRHSRPKAAGHPAFAAEGRRASDIPAEGHRTSGIPNNTKHVTSGAITQPAVYTQRACAGCAQRKHGTRVRHSI